MTKGYAQLGEVFTVPVAHKRVTFLIGPDVAPHFFKGTDDEMSQTEVRHGNASNPSLLQPTPWAVCVLGQCTCPGLVSWPL
jgi:hypothetical protein